MSASAFHVSNAAVNVPLHQLRCVCVLLQNTVVSPNRFKIKMKNSPIIEKLQVGGLLKGTRQLCVVL